MSLLSSRGFFSRVMSCFSEKQGAAALTSAYLASLTAIYFPVVSLLGNEKFSNDAQDHFRTPPGP